MGAVQAQSLELNTLALLPPSLNENSGLALATDGQFWTHNDSGGEPALYRIDSSGAITRTLHIKGASNVDWEDLTRDKAGNLYIGDFGNNSNTRTDLRIYRISNPDIWPLDSIEAGIIHFSYPDQTEFPPPAERFTYDMEAMVHFGGHLYLFSKNQSEPFTGYTRIYRLPELPGSYSATLLDSFFTGSGPALFDWVSSADVSPDGEHLVLLGYDKIWLFSCRNGRSFLKGQRRTIPISGGMTQKEAILFVDAQNLIISDENLFGFLPARLYSASLAGFLPEDCCPAPEDLEVQSPSAGKLNYRWKEVGGADAYRLRLSGSDGSLAQRLTKDTFALMPGLSPSTMYSAYVQARCGNLISSASDTLAFSAMRSGEVPAPLPPETDFQDLNALFRGLSENPVVQQWTFYSPDGRLLKQFSAAEPGPAQLSDLPGGWLIWQRQSLNETPSGRESGWIYHP